MEILETIKQIVLERIVTKRSGVNLSNTEGAVGAAVHRPTKHGSRMGKAANPNYRNKLERSAKERIVKAVRKIADNRAALAQNARNDAEVAQKLKAAQWKAENVR